MDISNQLNEIIENAKKLTLELKEDTRIDNLKEDLTEVTTNAVDKASKYVIKAMPVPDAVKDILIDVSEVLKTKDFKKIISTTITSTVREGLEALGVSSTNIKSLMELKDVAQKGGYITAIKNGVEIIANNYLKDNIVGNYVYKFFNELKVYIQNRGFINKVEDLIKKLDEKKDEFFNRCEDWFKAYKNMNLENINKISEQLNERKYVLSRYTDCIKENNLIQNMTAMVNNKQALLSKEQQRLCEVL